MAIFLSFNLETGYKISNFGENMYFKNVCADKFRLKYILYQSKHYSLQYIRYATYTCFK